MTTSGLGGALVLIAVGAILFAQLNPACVDIDAVGLILMIVGAMMIFLTLLFVFRGRQPPGTMPPPPY